MTGKYWDKNSQQWVSHPPAGSAAPPPPAAPPVTPPPPSAPPLPPPPPVAPPLITPRAPRPEGPPATGERRSRRVLVAALAGALVGVLAGGGGYLLTRHEGGGTKPVGAAPVTGTPTRTASGSHSSSPSATAPQSPSPAATTPTPAPTPTGPHLNRVQDPNGFTLLVPDGWQRREQNGSTFYETPDQTSLVQVFSMTTQSPYEQAKSIDASLAETKASAGYRRLRLEQTANGTAELEYSYNHAETGTVRRAVDHILVGPNGVAYSVIVAGPDGDWPTRIQALRDAELTGFCFAAQCPAATG